MRLQLALPKQTSGVRAPLLALVDVLTVLVVFLLFGFGTTESELRGATRLPTARHGDPRPTSLAITLEGDELRVGEETVTRLVEGRWMPDALGDEQRVIPLLEALQRLRAQQLEKSRGHAAVMNVADVIALKAPPEISYQLISQVMSTVSYAGFSGVLLEVVNHAPRR